MRRGLGANVGPSAERFGREVLGKHESREESSAFTGTTWGVKYHGSLSNSRRTNQRCVADAPTADATPERTEEAASGRAAVGDGAAVCSCPAKTRSAAGRAVSLQRLLEGKVQLHTNLSTSQSYLDATDTALSGVADMLANARGLAVQAADNTTSDLERQAMALEIEATISQMLEVGNQSFRGRYLFAGTDSTARPFESSGGYIAYHGNDVTFRTLADSGFLFDTNVPGQDLFGAISSEVRGIDLNPILTANTRLSDLRGGLGITEGSIVISDGTVSSTVSLAGAQTIGDVARLIEDNPPAGRTILPRSAQGLDLDMNDGGGGSLIVTRPARWHHGRRVGDRAAFRQRQCADCRRRSGSDRAAHDAAGRNGRRCQI